MTVDLTTRYLGMTLKNPLVVAANPLNSNLDQLRRFADAGAAAAVMPSLFEEQLVHDELEINALYEYQTESFAESLTHFPELGDYNTGPRAYLDKLAAAKKAVSIPIIGSLNGASPGGWTRYARQIQDAGADALELNIYFVPTDPRMSSAEVEQRYIDLVAEVRSAVSIPLAVKFGSHFTSMPHFAQQLVAAGADGLTLFNRYLDPEIDLEKLDIFPDLVLSARHELRLPLRWIAILRDQLSVSIAATSGIHVADDVVKAILVGADVTMMAATLLKHGADQLRNIEAGLRTWLEEREYVSVEQLKGSMSRTNCPNPSALERANYMKALMRYTAQLPTVQPN